LDCFAACCVVLNIKGRADESSTVRSYLGLLINFIVPVPRDGIRRYVVRYQEERDNAEAQSYEGLRERLRTDFSEITEKHD
jgi:hypothetical protein